MLNFERINVASFPLRQAYLTELSEPQEFYLEQLVRFGTVWQIEGVAYGIISEQKQLIEFFVLPEHGSRTKQIFDTLLLNLGVQEVLCKSYDQPLLQLALARSTGVQVVGHLFRHIHDTSFTPRKHCIFRLANAADVAMIASKNDDFFDSKEEIEAYLHQDGLYILQVEGIDVGCGLAKVVVDGRADVDIGMWVMPEHRGNMYGTHIVRYLKHHFLKMGMRPICGCDVENVVSYRTLVSAGFVSMHQIFAISVAPRIESQ